MINLVCVVQMGLFIHCVKTTIHINFEEVVLDQEVTKISQSKTPYNNYVICGKGMVAKVMDNMNGVYLQVAFSILAY